VGDGANGTEAVPTLIQGNTLRNFGELLFVPDAIFIRTSSPPASAATGKSRTNSTRCATSPTKKTRPRSAPPASIQTLLTPSQHDFENALVQRDK